VGQAFAVRGGDHLRQLSLIEARPIDAECTVIACDLLAAVDVPARNRTERELLCVRVGAVVKEFSVIAGQNEATTEIARSVSKHIDVFAEYGRQIGPFFFRDDAIKLRLKPPYRCSSIDVFASEDTISVNLTRPDPCSDQKHATIQTIMPTVPNLS
jgi:hypothetical protein